MNKKVKITVDEKRYNVIMDDILYAYGQTDGTFKVGDTPTGIDLKIVKETISLLHDIKIEEIR